MKIKFNWGTGILAAIIIMVAGLGVLVAISVRQDFSLVEKDYYQKGIDYQQHIERVKNSGLLSEKIAFLQKGKNLELKFPACTNNAKPAGRIEFYSPVNSANDFNLEIKMTESSMQVVNLDQLKHGRYIVKITWNCDSTGYYQEFNLTIE